ncbi:MAG: hypothetical protein ACR2OZ_12665 [Verrucomicrobiales bacterium]
MSFALTYHPAPLERLTVEELWSSAQTPEPKGTPSVDSAKSDSDNENDHSPQAGRLIKHRKFREEFRREKLELTSGEPRLLEVRESVAPDGSPEFGRWHALVVRATVLK